MEEVAQWRPHGGGVKERAQEEFLAYKRTPETSISTYLANLKLLKMECLRQNPETCYSDGSWAQRMLNKASLSRRERLD